MKIALNHIELDTLVRKHVSGTGLVSESQAALATITYERTRGGRVTATIDLDPPEVSPAAEGESAAPTEQ